MFARRRAPPGMLNHVRIGVRRRAFVLAIIASAVTGCATFAISEGPTQSALRNLLQPQALAIAVNGSGESDQVLSFYRARDFLPAWTGGTENEAMAAEARSILGRAADHGLLREDYSVELAGVSLDPGTDAAQYEIAMTTAVLRYASDVGRGRVRPSDVYRDVELPVPDFDAAAALNQAVNNRSVGGFLAALPPNHPEYHRLVEALAEYRALDDGTAIARIRIGDGQSTSQRRLVVAQLSLDDPDLAAQTNPTAREVRDAVQRFQARNGLAVDGIAGPKTLAALVTQSTARIELIKANLERWRWLPRRFEDRYVSVNVPDQSLAFNREGGQVFTSRVIVGHKSSPTPILRTNIASVKANPPWNVPGDIAARDLLPYMRRNPNYLAERNMVLLDTLDTDPHGRLINWNEVKPSQFYYHVRQLPGLDTALGELMLDMPNDFDVYLHDTPTRHLFAQEDRAVSNGCIRVEDIFPLASLALANDPMAGVERIRRAIATGETQFLDLDDPLPVYLLYWTVVVSPDGNLSFPPDRYDRDQVLIEALNAPRGASSLPISLVSEHGSEPTTRSRALAQINPGDAY